MTETLTASGLPTTRALSAELLHRFYPLLLTKLSGVLIGTTHGADWDIGGRGCGFGFVFGNLRARSPSQRSAALIVFKWHAPQFKFFAPRRGELLEIARVGGLMEYVEGSAFTAFLALGQISKWLTAFSSTIFEETEWKQRAVCNGVKAGTATTYLQTALIGRLSTNALAVRLPIRSAPSRLRPVSRWEPPVWSDASSVLGRLKPPLEWADFNGTPQRRSERKHSRCVGAIPHSLVSSKLECHR